MLLEQLQIQTGLSEKQIERYASTASKRYKSYTIPKRTGGVRVIHQPSQAIKALQRWLVHTLIRHFPIHECATAYSKGASIKENALAHVRSNFTLHADFQSFFPSFTGYHVEDFLNDKVANGGLPLTTADIQFIRRVVCRYDSLTIGAPSSPLLTNALMFDFDSSMYSWCKDMELTYTRYADDLFVSSMQPGLLKDVISKIEEFSIIHRFSQLKLNDKKTAFLSRRYHRAVTGIVITPNHNLSIGLERKTQIKSDIYKYQQGNLHETEWIKVRGMLAFVQDVEPIFYSTLVRKYGKSTIESLERLGKKK